MTLTPKTNTQLFGHEEAEAQLMQELASGKLAHGWIISGSRGIGKATLAYRFARILLSQDSGSKDSSPNPESRILNPIFKRIIAGSHSDLLVIEPEWDDKKEEYKSDISVGQAREIAQFLSLTPGEGQWRVVIIDSVDALNNQAANAILKILEEPPPQAVLLLISHNPGRLLPTIRSRCRSLRLNPLSHADFCNVVQMIAPDTLDYELELLAELSEYSPGVALSLKEQAAPVMFEQLQGIFSNLADTPTIHAFAEQFSGTGIHSKWHIFTRLALHVLREAAKGRHTLADLHPPHVWARKWQEASEQFLLAERLHLDYKQVIITFFHSILAEAGIQLTA